MMIEDRIAVSRASAWTMGHYPADMHHVEVWDLTGVSLAYRDGGVWKDAVTGNVMPMSAEITHWREVWSPSI